ncbi:MAG: hypothetical protein E7089_02365 [Bacteroidales bacterium]|nr:hypothetical protein [Bacteroidales bacterium]
MDFEVTDACINNSQQLLQKKYSVVKITGNDRRGARIRGVKKLLLFIEWSIAWLVRIKLLDKRRQ